MAIATVSYAGGYPSLEAKVRRSVLPPKGSFYYRMEVEYGFHLLGGNRQPHFAITANAWRTPQAYGKGSRGISACGCMHEDIAKYAPDLKPLIKWHLIDQDGVPMHYVANGVYWLGKIGKPPDRYDHADPLEALKSTIMHGAVEGDEGLLNMYLDALPKARSFDDQSALVSYRNDHVAEKETIECFEAWLISRKPKLLEAMLKDMAAFNVPLIPQEEIDAFRSTYVKEAK